MTASAPNRRAFPKKLPLASLLGLREEGDLDWPRLRAIQHSVPASKIVVRMASHATLALVTATILYPIVPIAILIGWIAFMAASLGLMFQADMNLQAKPGRTLSKGAAARHLRGTISAALAWSLASPLALYFGTPADVLAVWAVIAAVITGITITLGTAPMGAILFSVIVMVPGAVSLLAAGYLSAAFAAGVMLPIACWGFIVRADTFLRGSLAEDGMNERSEVVSLLLREFEENEADWLWQIDTSRRIRSASPRFAFALGLDSADVEGKPFLELISGEHWETGQFPTSLHDLAERLKRRESFSALLVKVTINGKNRWWELSGTPMLDNHGKHVGFRGVGSDVTEQRESTEKIAYLARYDTLTKLPNRLMLNESLGDAMRYARQWRSRCAFLMIDLDRFKQVNDSLGHQVGDRLLEKVAERLKEICGENEICGRLGGDEFAIVIREASDPAVVSKVANRIISRLSEPYAVDNHTLFVGASVGSAVAPRDGKSVEELMRNADLALYRSKDEGGGEHFTYEPALHASAEERRQLEFSLRKALERNELLLHYQPVVNAGSEDLVGFEALVRWNSRDHGFVSPAKFIPLAEETRLIVPIGTWVLQRACMEAAKWPSHVRVNINVSPEQLLEPGFPNTVVQALSRANLDPQRLEIEVTESIFLRDASVARAALEQVMALGCQIALDDFGTGYSSLGYIRELRFSTIKVDRTFVQGAAQGARESEAIIRAVVAMAQSLDMTTTAEGVETAGEAEMIRNMGCTKIQGYYFGRPMPVDEVHSVLRHQQQMRA
ncbi:EAL domain-containing protein [Erythrobacteraceae bacterium WH01K]|nr:EAL domain-containing protein [Erythrobacteraceae bacterium WH01K]